eukprot:573740-Rhodomonas_salina.2
MSVGIMDKYPGRGYIMIPGTRGTRVLKYPGYRYPGTLPPQHCANTLLFTFHGGDNPELHQGHCTTTSTTLVMTGQSDCHRICMQTSSVLEKQLLVVQISNPAGPSSLYLKSMVESSVPEWH